MSHKDIYAVSLVTAYLCIYSGLIFYESPYAIVMLLFSPFLICWMVYIVLKFGKYNGKDLGEDEFGYQDKAKDELGIF